MTYLTELVKEAKDAVKNIHSLDALEVLRTKYLGKKGFLVKEALKIRTLDPSTRPAAGAIINRAIKDMHKIFIEKKLVLKQLAMETSVLKEKLDVSLPGRQVDKGGLHPISHVISRVKRFFRDLGFKVVSGSEIEDSYHNFDALNILSGHPARTNSDTFWFDTKTLLRTQTSSVQIRVMKSKKPPVRIISAGKVYRNDYDQMHTPMFHQVEGLFVDTSVHFANLKCILHNFLNNFFEKKLKIRFRPSYFPFTEPSAEIDIMGNNNCWTEVIGCGLVHPNVLRNTGIDPQVYSGFAFGIGIERLAMLRYKVTDLRVFFENDLNFLKQFK